MKPAPFFDLHLHSNYSSDGEWTVDRLFSKAEELGIIALAISDHDTVAALQHRPEIEHRFPSVEWIPNVEISSALGEKELHLLAPFVDYKSPVLIQLLSRIHNRRDEQARGRMERLRAIGIEVTEEEVRIRFGHLPITGPAIAHTVLEKYRKNPLPVLLPYLQGEKKSQAESSFYRDFFSRGKSAHVPKTELAASEAISVVRSLGGVPVLAHPGARFTQVDERLIAQLKEIGLEGLEVWTSYHDSLKAQYYLAIAESLDLIGTAGSDFHGRAKPNVEFGSIRQGTPAILAELRKRSKDYCNA
jgi:hypothetical protein